MNNFITVVISRHLQKSVCKAFYYNIALLDWEYRLLFRKKDKCKNSDRTEMDKFIRHTQFIMIMVVSCLSIHTLCTPVKVRTYKRHRWRAERDYDECERMTKLLFDRKKLVSYQGQALWDPTITLNSFSRWLLYPSVECTIIEDEYGDIIRVESGLNRNICTPRDRVFGYLITPAGDDTNDDDDEHHHYHRHYHQDHYHRNSERFYLIILVHRPERTRRRYIRTHEGQLVSKTARSLVTPERLPVAGMVRVMTHEEKRQALIKSAVKQWRTTLRCRCFELESLVASVEIREKGDKVSIVFTFNEELLREF